jgi:hypothetical protein
MPTSVTEKREKPGLLQYIMAQQNDPETPTNEESMGYG